jgi:hypothetical protein
MKLPLSCWLLWALLDSTRADFQRLPVRHRHRRRIPGSFGGFRSTDDCAAIHQHATPPAPRTEPELAILIQAHANAVRSRYGQKSPEDLKERLPPKRRSLLARGALKGSALVRRAPQEAQVKDPTVSGLATLPTSTGTPGYTSAAAAAASNAAPAGTNDAEAYAMQKAKVLGQQPNTGNTNGINVWQAPADTAKNLGPVDFGPGVECAYNMLTSSTGFFTYLSLGTKGGKSAGQFPVQIDTASADIWVPSSECPGCGKHLRLGTDTSDSLNLTSEPWSSPYSSSNLFGGLAKTSTVSGQMGYDTLRIGNKALLNFRLGVASKVPPEMGADFIPYLGVLGLGNTGVNPLMSYQGIDSFASTLLKGTVMSLPQIGIRLGQAADGSNVGELSYGGVNPSKYKGDLTVMKSVSTVGYWEAPVDAISVSGGGTISERTGILDSRTVLLYAPQADIISLFSGVPNACESSM